MEQSFEVEIDISIEYEVGSPPSDSYDPYLEASPHLVVHHMEWQGREGPDEGDITTATTAVYPNFTDHTRRSIFCIASYGVGGTIAVTWNGVAMPIGHIWLLTDPSWTATGQVIASAGEGCWFACEGELPDDFRVQRPGSNQSFSL